MLRVSWLARDPSLAFEGKDYLMDGWWGYDKEALHVGFGRWAFHDERIGMNEGQILTLLVGEGRFLDRVVHVLSDIQKGLSLEPFIVHDLRRTGSTQLNTLGFNSDWIEKCRRMRTAVPHAESTTRRNAKRRVGT